MSELSFSDLQKLTESSYTVEQTREDLRKIVDLFKSTSYYAEAVEVAFVSERRLSWDTAKACECFFVDEDETINFIPEELRSQALGMCRGPYLVYAGRLVYPVKDPRGNIMGFCGWDKYEQPKYLDSRNHGYKAKVGSMYGMEELYNYYTNGQKIFLLEGLVDVLYLREKGYCALSTLGSYINGYIVNILKRFGDRLIVVPDCDEAGEQFVKQTKRVLPKATVLQVKQGKDIDGCRKIEDGIYEEKLLKDLERLKTIPVGLEMFYVR